MNERDDSTYGFSPLFMLDDDGMRRIHEGALRILNEVGIVIKHNGILEKLQEAGASVDRDTQLAKFPPSLVEDAIKNAPSSFLIAGRHPRNDVFLEVGGKTYTRTVGGPDYIIDSDEAIRRQVLKADLENWIRLIDSLVNIHLAMPVFPHDVPLASRDVYVFERMLEGTSKPLMIQAYSGESLKWMIRMIDVVSGGVEAMRSRPIISVYVSANSPLQYSGSQLEVLIEAGRHGIPVFLNSSPVSGAQGPVTVGGTFLLMNAETLAGLAISQIMNPGAPIVYTPKPYIFDMKMGMASTGYVEGGILASAITQLGAQFYNLPTESLGISTDSLSIDVQTGFEKVFGGIFSFLSGANVVGGGGLLGSAGTASLTQLVIDDEIFGMMYRSIGGVDLSEDKMGYEAIARVGPGQHFLIDDHTLKYFKEEYFHAELSNRQPPQVWEEKGRPGTLENAREKEGALLTKDNPDPLDEKVIKELRSILEKSQGSRVRG